MGCLKEVCFFLLLARAVVTAVDRNQTSYKVVCYLDSFATYRNGDAKFLIEDIDPFLCTHLIFRFVDLESDKFDLFDPTFGFSLGSLTRERLNNLKKKNLQLKTLIGTRGWPERSQKYSAVASSPVTRAFFIKRFINFCRTDNFDGLDVDWEYPDKGSPQDKHNFAALLGELKEAFALDGLLLSAAFSARKSINYTDYNIKLVSRLLDFINIMAYDFHGSWEAKTGHNSPLYARDDEPEQNKFLNVDYAVQYWINQGADREKIILGMALYGRSFTLANPNNNGIGAPATGAGKHGMALESGKLGYNEICLNVKNGWTEVFVPGIEAPYAFQGDQWVGYDNKKSIGIKADYIIKNNLGGGMVWSLETDDFRGKCFGEKFPLLRTLATKLNGAPTSDPSPINRETQVSPTSEPSPITREPQVSPTSPTSVPCQEFTCKKDGYFRDTLDCSKYHCCVAQQEGVFAHYTFSCGKGTVFDDVANTCNFKMDVNFFLFPK